MKPVKPAYQVIDHQTGKVVGTYATAQAARRARDRKDLEYGAIRYYVAPVGGAR